MQQNRASSRLYRRFVHRYQPKVAEFAPLLPFLKRIVR